MSTAGSHPATHPSQTILHAIVEVACKAPSIYNTQPWAWRASAGALELYSDRSRGLPAADPDGRNLVISCGAALHHAQVAAASLGWAAHAERQPSDEDPDLLAVLTFTPDRVTEEQVRLFRALEARRTDRRRFALWPVPPERLHRLAGTAAAWGARAYPVTDAAERHTLETLIDRALSQRASDDRVGEEQRSWIDHGPDDGVPSFTVPRLLGLPTSYRSRFGAGLLPQPGRDLESEDGVLVLCARDDDRKTWLRVGESLSAMWLHAVESGLSLVPLTQVIELPETRRALQDDVLRSLLVPHLLVRVGWHAVDQEPLARTPRRPLEDVLLP